MGVMASQITSPAIVYSTVYSDADQKKTSKLCVTGLCAGNSPRPVKSPHKWPAPRKMASFDDVIMWPPYLPPQHWRRSSFLVYPRPRAEHTLSKAHEDGPSRRWSPARKCGRSEKYHRDDDIKQSSLQWINNGVAGDLRCHDAHVTTWASWYLRSLVTPLFIQQCVQDDMKVSTKAPHNCPPQNGGFASKTVSNAANVFNAWCHNTSYFVACQRIAEWLNWGDGLFSCNVDYMSMINKSRSSDAFMRLETGPW